MQNKQNISPETMDKLKEELELLKGPKRRELALRLKEAISFGDLKENAAYHEAKDDQAFLEGRIIELESIIRNSSVSLKEKSNNIEIGSSVIVECDGSQEVYIIVSSIEANPLENKISLDSPIGKILFGKKVGDFCKMETLDGDIVEYKIIEVK
ncbi:MAG: transcription elongation factor GreA [Candidatus Pacebacteria bacterium]|nr:transcription elongation factor GreA [Candidatus Paceibacterota bacterium]